jgi:hypothetical protein
MCFFRALIFIAVLAAIGAGAAPRAAARVIEVGPKRDFKLPSAAAAVARSGDIVRIDPGEYSDCAVWSADKLVIEGRGIVVIRDKVCQDKAIFVTAGANIKVRGIEFAHARSSHKNGAGIRAEGANLVVENSRFTDNENGILSGPNLGSHILIRNSVFTGNGKCDPVCAHGIYIGTIGLLQVVNSTFLMQKEGHHIKSRALRSEIIATTIKDGPTGTASFSVDIPDGGSLVLRNDVIEKGPLSENHQAAVSIGEESKRNPTNELTIESNVFQNEGAPTSFIRNETLTPARLVGNRLTGNAVPLAGPGTVNP